MKPQTKSGPKILAVIPARGGSKRIKNKNLKHLMGKPLIQWTIDLALKAKIFDDIIVSTDSITIQKTAERLGASAPFLRPDELASDVSPTIDTVLHAIDWYENNHRVKLDCVVLLQPTTPFRSMKIISESVKSFIKNKNSSMVSVSRVSEHPAWMLSVNEMGPHPYLSWMEMSKRSQDLDELFILNGLFYAATPSFLRKNRDFINSETQLKIMDNFGHNIDIDEENDWLIAEAVAQLLTK